MHRFGTALTCYEYFRKIGKSPKCRYKYISRHNSSGLPKFQPDDLNVSSVENIYRKWLDNPSSVGDGWNKFFLNISGGKPAGKSRNDAHRPSSLQYGQERGYAGGHGTNDKAVNENMSVLEMIRRYQTKGYYLATLDPLGLYGAADRAPYVVSKDIPYKHIKDEHKKLVEDIKAEIDNEQVFKLPPNTFIGGNENALSLKQIIKRLEETYCQSFGIEYGHMNSVEQCNWIKKKFELPGAAKLSKDLKRLTLARLIRTTGYETFVAKKFPSIKRFSAEGAEMLIPCMKQIIDKSTEFGVECVVIGMAHRARINIVANVCRQPLDKILTQFQNLDVVDPAEADVKYHLGVCLDRLNKVTNKNIRVILMANPSHLECVGGLLMGRAKSEQFYRNDALGTKVLPIAVHGDAAVCGQGVVYEIVQFSDIPSFTTFGSVHIILNNQLGFTTIPIDGRSCCYPSDVGKIVNAPVIHVNGNDPEAVIHAANVAAEWRAVFHKDIFLDIVLYRKLGHNEGDEPALTQPQMYSKIHAIKPILDLYSEKLISEGLVSAKEVDETKLKYEKICEAAFEESKKHKLFTAADWIDSPWPENALSAKQELPITGIPEDVLLHIAKSHSSGGPQGFVTHKGLDRIFKGRQDLINHKMMDWSLAEACAFGSILKEGFHVRICGQDTQRGTFSHRHYILHHQTDESIYTPLANLYPNQGKFIPVNSCLSEYAVLGFEFGYSQTSPATLCVWEAQFGDFQDTAQCLFDCFIANSQAKWHKQSGLVMNLPHGLEGMGADHSSARPERFLLMCDDDPNKFSTAADAAFQQLRTCNWIVAQVTTPANLFHIYRRQMHMPFRKPLVNFFPKSLIRLPAARSPLDDFKEGTYFKRIIPDPVDPSGVKKVMFSVGKVYYDLIRARHTKKMDKEIALVRIEQVNPFPYDLLAAEIAKYPNAKFCFGQEEHMNQGYHLFVMPRLQKLLPGKEIKLITRPSSAASAAAFPKTHQRQLMKLLQEFIDA